MMKDTIPILCNIINQIFAVEIRLSGEQHDKMSRKFQRIAGLFEELHLYVHNPNGEVYNETRLDCEASISGDKVDNLIIREVIKPIIYYKENGENKIIQRAVVVVG